MGNPYGVGAVQQMGAPPAMYGMAHQGNYAQMPPALTQYSNYGYGNPTQLRMAQAQQQQSGASAKTAPPGMGGRDHQNGPRGGTTVGSSAQGASQTQHTHTRQYGIQSHHYHSSSHSASTAVGGATVSSTGAAGNRQQQHTHTQVGHQHQQQPSYQTQSAAMGYGGF